MRRRTRTTLRSTRSQYLPSLSSSSQDRFFHRQARCNYSNCRSTRYRSRLHPCWTRLDLEGSRNSPCEGSFDARGATETDDNWCRFSCSSTSLSNSCRSTDNARSWTPTSCNESIRRSWFTFSRLFERWPRQFASSSRRDS